MENIHQLLLTRVVGRMSKNRNVNQRKENQMQTFTGFEYLMIDTANQFGLDKLLFEERIQWVKDHMDTLEDHVDSADNKYLFKKAVMAIRKAQQKVPTGHLVGFDATCSG